MESKCTIPLTLVMSDIQSDPEFSLMPPSVQSKLLGILSKHTSGINGTRPVVLSSPASPDPSQPESIDMDCDTASVSSKKRAASQRSESSPSVSDSDSSAHTLTDGFTTVKGKHKRRAKRNATDDPVPVVAPTTPTPVVKPLTPLMEVPIDGATIQRAAPLPPTQPTLAKAKSPPPVFLRDKSRWTDVSDLCKTHKVNFTRASNTGVAIKVDCPTVDDFRGLIRLLTVNKIPFHTFALPEERKVRAVLRGVPTEISTTEISKDLTAQGYPVEAVHFMHSRTGKTFPLALVILTNAANARDIFRAKELTVCGLSGVRVEAPHRRGTPGQCHRCQLYGHAAANCSASPRCVKCLDPHFTKECTRTRDSPSPPACVLCGRSGHTANYRGCPRAPRPHPPTVKGPRGPPLIKRAPQAPQAPPPPTKANFPDLPKAVLSNGPAPKPAWGPPPKARAPPSPVAPAPPGSVLDDFNVVFSFINGINISEVTLVANKLRAARNSQDALMCMAQHATLLNTLQSKFTN